eukprot:3423288-Rhodomonas_salina.1
MREAVGTCCSGLYSVTGCQWGVTVPNQFFLCTEARMIRVLRIRRLDCRRAGLRLRLEAWGMAHWQPGA